MLRGVRGVKRRDTTLNVFAGPNGLCENAETAISCEGPELARNMRHTSSREEEKVDAQTCPRGEAIE